MAEIDEKQVFAIIQKAKDTGEVKVGANEVTKTIERGQAKLVATASDVSPAEIVAHLPGLCKEMNIICSEVGTKAELGSAAGIKSTTALAVVDAGNGKKELDALVKEAQEDSKKEEQQAAEE